MKIAPASRALLVLVAWAVASPAAAQTLYKLIDKDGKVTYSEKPPKDFGGKVIPMEIDPNRNTATLPKPTKEDEAAARRRAIEEGKAGSRAPSQGAKREVGEKGVDSADRLKEAQERLEAARAALKDAQDSPNPGDMTFVQNKGGGARPVPSEAYAKRLTNLETRVKIAEEDVKRAEDAR
jgi:hypothetical protein